MNQTVILPSKTCSWIVKQYFVDPGTKLSPKPIVTPKPKVIPKNQKEMILILVLSLNLT